MKVLFFGSSDDSNPDFCSSRKDRDILLLLKHLLGRFALENGMSMKGMSKDGAGSKGRWFWSGTEMSAAKWENAMERAVVLANGDAIGADEICTSQSSMADSDSDTQSGRHCRGS